ncbi:hypothetical protein F5141DRAFT_593180 [Pisolithus sp. B1]|nr:hypothetical protein F5141DRAFT_593180 [Pisolithus sp. B1]
MSYSNAIAWLNGHDVLHEAEDAEGNTIKDVDGKPVMVLHAVGDDIAETAEWQRPILSGISVCTASRRNSRHSLCTKCLGRTTTLVLCSRRAAICSY